MASPDDEPNWGLAFGSGAFLIVWCVGFLAQVPYEVLFARAVVAAILGTLLGVAVGYTVGGLKTLRENLEKGSRVDFVVGEDEELPLKLNARPSREKETGIDGDEHATEVGDPDPGFKPVDLKSASKHVQSMLQE